MVIDDGSTDDSCRKIANLPIKIHRTGINKGRGFVRNLAMKLCKNDLVLCCDGTNSLSPKFLEIAIQHIENDSHVCSVSGIIKAKQKKKGVVSRWRSRHLFKEDIVYPINCITKTKLVTYGTLVRKKLILEAGNFNPDLTHSEDEELGERLINSGFRSIGDPKLITYSEINNNLVQVLERHWRWHIGKYEKINLNSYLHLIKGSLNPMMVADLKAGDPLSCLISLFYPHFFLMKTLSRRVFSR